MDNRIYKVLRRKNLTQGELAEIIGIRREHLNRIIHRKITPTIPLGMRIAKALEVKMEYLFILPK